MKIGDEMVWRHKPRGGYGYVERVPCTVVAVGQKRVVIEVENLDGQKVQKIVRAENLEAKE